MAKETKREGIRLNRRNAGGEKQKVLRGTICLEKKA